MELCGWIVDRIDIEIDGTNHDLTKDHIIKEFEAKLAGSFYGAMHLGTECTTFSRGTWPPYRDNANLAGYDVAPAHRKEITKTGNLLATNSLRLWNAGARGKVLMSWENPAESMLWLWPGIDKVKATAINTVCCYCRYNRPYRKRTRFLTTYQLPDECALMCNHPGAHKQQLRGWNPDAGCAWSKSANRYPLRLARGIARQATRMKMK